MRLTHCSFGWVSEKKGWSTRIQVDKGQLCVERIMNSADIHALRDIRIVYGQLVGFCIYFPNIHPFIQHKPSALLNQGKHIYSLCCALYCSSTPWLWVWVCVCVSLWMCVISMTVTITKRVIHQLSVVLWDLINYMEEDKVSAAHCSGQLV